MLLCNMMVSAHDFEVDGIYYNYLDGNEVEVTYRGLYSNSYHDEYLDSITLFETVTFNDTIYNVTSIGDSAFAYCSSLTSVVICNSITNIGMYAFDSCYNITSITIGNAVRQIRQGTFKNCSSLNSITIPNSVTYIGNNAFFQCKYLSSITIGNGVTIIGSGAFRGCWLLTSITIPESVTSIGSYAFYDCQGLSSVTLGNSVTSIGDSAFYFCYRLTSVVIPNSLTNLGESAFYQCWSLASVTIGNGLKKIRANTFYECSSLTSVVIGSSVTSVEGNAFDRCISLISATINSNALVNSGASDLDNIFPRVKHYVIGDSVTSIGDSAFSSGSLTSITIGNSVTRIGEYAFFSCKGLVSISLPESVTHIGKSAFSGCKSLTSVTIPNSVTNIGLSAFYNCSNLQSLTIGAGVTYIGENQSIPTKVIWLPNTPPSGYRNLLGIINYVPNQQYSGWDYIYPYLSSMFEVNGVKYIPTSPSERTCDIIDCVYDSTNVQITLDSTVVFQGIELITKELMPYAFYSNKYIKEVSVANSGNIESFAFASCEHIETLVVSNSGDVGASTFSDCINLTSATIFNEGNLESNAFKGCSSLATVELGNRIGVLGDNVFEQCSTLQDIDIPNSITSIGGRCFYDCSRIKKIIIGNNVTSIGSGAFENCSSLSEITIPQAVTSIENYVFKGCASLVDVIIEDRSTELNLGSNGSSPLFADCPLDSVYIGGKITYNTSKYSGYSPFYHNNSLRTVTITNQEDQIYENEFYGCTNLKNVTIGHGIKNIGDRAFSGCSSLDKFSFGSKVKSIGAEAFSDCTKMTEITSYATIPPVCGAQALDDINKWSCVLKIPKNCTSAYQAAEQWKEFFFIEDVAEIKKYAVIYMVNDTIFAIDSLAIGDAVTPIEEPIKEGYTFSGWSDAPATMPAEDIIIKGAFSVNYYALKYVVDNEPYATDSLAYGTVIELREAPTKDDYIFSGWSKVPETMPAYDVEVTGNFIFTDVSNIDVQSQKTKKVIENQQLFIILPNGQKYNVMGQEL